MDPDKKVNPQLMNLMYRDLGIYVDEEGELTTPGSESEDPKVGQKVETQQEVA